MRLGLKEAGIETDEPMNKNAIEGEDSGRAGELMPLATRLCYFFISLISTSVSLEILLNNPGPMDSPR